MDQQTTVPLMMTDKKPDWSFYVAWVSVTCLCIPAAYLIAIMLMVAAVAIMGDTIYVNGIEHITEDYLALFVIVPLMGLLTGAGQYGLLRKILPRIGWWVPATLAGWLLGTFSMITSIRLGMEPGNIRLAFLLLGLSIGFTQWLVLRRLPAAGWWIIANLLGWGALALFTQGNTYGPSSVFLGFFPACTTAAVLWLWIRK